MAIAKRKKRFFDVEIPLISKTTHLQAFEMKELDGRNIKYDLTRILRGKSILLDLKVSVNEDKVIAIPRKITLMPYFLRRMVRKGTNYVEDSFSTECKDAQLRIKPILVTRKKVSRAVRKALREKAKKELIEYVKIRKSKDLFDELLKNQLQKPLSLKLKKIYPLSLCEIRVFQVEKELRTKEKEVKKEKSEVKKELELKEKEVKKEESGVKKESKTKKIGKEKSEVKKESEIKEKSESGEKSSQKSKVAKE